MVNIGLNEIFSLLLEVNNKLIICFGQGRAGTTITFSISYNIIPRIICQLHANSNSTGILSVSSRSKTSFQCYETISNGAQYNEVINWMSIAY